MTTSVERNRPRGRNDVFGKFGLALVFVVLIITFSTLKPHTFATVLNAQSILSTQAVLALLAMAALVPLVVGQFDVSVGFQLGLSQTLCAGLMTKNHLPTPVAALLAIAACLAVGAANGLLVSRLRLMSFTATLAVGTLVLGFTELYGRDLTISGPTTGWFVDLGRKAPLGIPIAFLYVVLALVVLFVALEYTAWGRECYATGGNPRAAHLAGVLTQRVTLQAYLLSGFLCGIAGVLSVSILGAAAPSVGLGSLLPAFAAVFLGATAIRPGRFNVVGTVLAIYFLATGVTGLQMLGADFYVADLFYGGALLLALLLSAMVARRRGQALT